jgi:hypothetical protein
MGGEWVDHGWLKQLDNYLKAREAQTEVQDNILDSKIIFPTGLTFFSVLFPANSNHLSTKLQQTQY